MKNPQEIIREAFEYADVTIDKAIAVTDGGSSVECELEIEPEDFLAFAEKDLSSQDIRALTNALSNAKRAIDAQVAKILKLLRIRSEAAKKGKLDFLNDIHRFITTHKPIDRIGEIALDAANLRVALEKNDGVVAQREMRQLTVFLTAIPGFEEFRKNRTEEREQDRSAAFFSAKVAARPSPAAHSSCSEICFDAQTRTRKAL